MLYALHATFDSETDDPCMAPVDEQGDVGSEYQRVQIGVSVASRNCSMILGHDNGCTGICLHW